MCVCVLDLGYLWVTWIVSVLEDSEGFISEGIGQCMCLMGLLANDLDTVCLNMSVISVCVFVCLIVHGFASRLLGRCMCV